MFEIKKIYSFNTLAPTLLGMTHTEMKVIKIMTAEEAVVIKDIQTQYTALKNVIDSLPSLDDCTFYLFEKQDENKTRILLASEYVDMHSINQVESLDLSITIYNTNTDMLSVVSTRLRELGINNFKIEQKRK